VANTAKSAVGAVHKLDHLALPAMDLNRAEAFYTEILDGVHIDRSGLDGVFLKFGATHIGLFTQYNTAVFSPVTLNSYPRCSIAYNDSYEKIVTRIKASTPRTNELTSQRNVVACESDGGLVFSDSEGNVLEILKSRRGDPTGLHHLHFETQDLEQSIEFYTQCLGMTVESSTSDFAVLSIAIANQQVIALHRVVRLSEATRTNYRERHFAFFAPDDEFHAIIVKLHRAGIDESDDIAQGVRRLQGELATYFRDPLTGIQLQLINRDSAYFCQKHGLTISKS
jgi:catechol 2,3-dioxygenase-like lactoylglutathione lyase family enzyme